MEEVSGVVDTTGNPSITPEDASKNIELLKESMIEKSKILARAFVLDSNNEWITVATGVAISELAKDKSSLNVSLHEETDSKTILFSASFHREQEILRQQATVVTWTGTDGSDIALSFEGEDGCDLFWIEICKFLGKPIEYIVHEEREESGIEGEEEEEEDGNGMGTVEFSLAGSRRASLIVSLPEQVEFNTVPDIDEALEAAMMASPDIKRQICMSLGDQSYVGKLLDLFRIAEDLDSKEMLFRLYNVFKHLILLNHPALLRELLSDGNIVHVAGVFEYDPAYPDVRPGYRQFLLDRQRFKQILPIKNLQLVDLIHQTFRAQYLKDVVLPRILDEETFGSLLFLIRCNFAEIVELLETEDEFMLKLIPLFQAESPEEQLQILKFMKEFLMIVKSSASGHHLKLYGEAAFGEFLSFVQRMLAVENTEARSLAIDVLIGVTQHDANTIRNFMIEEKEQPEGKQLLNAMIDKMTDEHADGGLRWQIAAILRTLLDTAMPLGLLAPNDEFLNFFYPDYASRLLDPFVKLGSSTAIQGTMNGRLIDVYYTIFELLCSFVIQHKYRMKYLLFKSLIVQNSLCLLQGTVKVLQMSALRLIRTMVGTGDDFYFRFLVKQNLLKPIVDFAISLGSSDSSISSAVIEFFYYIKDKRYKLLITHLVENQWAGLEKIKIAPVYADFCACYEELLDPKSALSSEIDLVKSKESSEIRDNWSRIDRTEEAYFSSVDEDDDEGDDANNRNGEGERERERDAGDEMSGSNDSLTKEMATESDSKSHNNINSNHNQPHQEVDITPKAIDDASVDNPSSITTSSVNDELENSKRMKY